MSKKCTPLWHEAHFEVDNVQNTPLSDHFWKLRCRKSARRCGAKHISKSKCTKHTIVGPLLEVAMSKKCMPLWREAHFQVKMYETHHCRTTFGSCDVEKVHAVVARSTFPSQNVQNRPCTDHFWKLRCRKSARRCGAKHISKSKCTKHTFAPCTDHFWRFRCRFAWQAQGIVDLVKSEQNVRVFVAFSTTTTTTLHYNPLHYITLHSTTLHYITQHYTTLPSTTLRYIYTTLHSTTLQLHLQLHSTTLNYTTLHYTTLHYIPRHSTTLHYITLTLH